MTIYKPDLARIHVEGYGFHWERAADSILNWLRRAGVNEGVVVDLGCGGGQWLNRLSAEGYQPIGIDASGPMIELARQTAPEATLLQRSMAEGPLPSCDAVTSLGEPLNYLPSGAEIRRVFRTVSNALRPGGLFIFDVRHPVTSPTPPREHAKVSANWACLARIIEDPKKQEIIRHITSFSKDAAGCYSRSDETHRLKVFAKAEIESWLRKVGFRVQSRRGYGDYQLGPRQSVFICRRPK